MGIYSVFVSGSRGAWVALPIVAIALISILKKTPLSRKLGSLIILIGVLYAAYQSPQLPVKSRVNHAMNEVIAYYQEDKVETSSGYRLEMWKGAWLMTKSSNFLGVGESQYPNHIVKLIQEGEVSKSIDKFIVPHNQYLNSLSEQGVIGIISLLMMMLIPLKVSLYSIKKNAKNKLIALYPALLIIAYLSFMLTGVTLERESMVVLYAFLMSMCMGILVRNK